MALVAAPALGNDGVMGGFSSDLVPLETTDVRMLAEDILIRDDGDAWDVTANYTFVNEAAKDVKLQVGFPEYACEDESAAESEMCIKNPLAFEGMQTLVEGKPVKHRLGKVQADHPWAPRLGRVWLYDVKFPAGAERHVSHRYRVRQGYVSDGTRVGTYVTRTGALWKGSIGQARFRVLVPVATHSLTTQASGLTESRNLIELEGKRYGELLFEGSDWNPEGDLHFGYNTSLHPDAMEANALDDSPKAAGFADTERCTAFTELWQAGYQLAESHRKEIPAGIVKHLAKKGIGSPRICRNLVYAMRGRRFEDDALNRYFYGTAGFVPGSWPYEILRPNPEFNDGMLTAGDRLTVSLIDAIAKEVPAKPAKEASPRPKQGKPVAAAGSEKQAPSKSVWDICAVGRSRGAPVTPFMLATLGLSLVVRRRRYWCQKSSGGIARP